MPGSVTRRILWIIPVLWAVATVTFFLMHAVPGGPFDREKELPPAPLFNLEKRYNLDKPLLVQYGLYLKGLAPGDLGLSFKNNREVADIIRDGFKVTAQLGIVAFLYAVVFGMTLGVIAALNQNRLGDYAGVFFATVGTAMPNFVIATFLVIIFSVKLGWFDVLGWGGPGWSEFYNPWAWGFRKGVLPGSGQGAKRVRSGTAAHYQERHGAHSHRARAKLRLPGHRLLYRRAYLRHQRGRPPFRGRRFSARLWGDYGNDPVLRRHRGCCQSGGGRPLRRGRPAHPVPLRSD